MADTKKAVIRKEKQGIIVWSPSKDSYFLPDDEAVRAIESIIAGRNDVSDTLRKTLTSLDITKQSRVIDNIVEREINAPLDIYFDYTYECNLKCGHCYNGKEECRVTMPADRIEKVLREVAKHGVMRTHLAGGEPMINPGLLRKYLETANAVGMTASVNSNGTLATEDILKMIFGNQIKTLTFSLDGATAQEHDALRGKGMFELTRSKAKLAAKIKRDNGYMTTLQYKIVHFFDTPLSTYEGMIQRAIEDGMDRVQFHNPECCVDHSKGHYSQQNVVDGYYERLLHLQRLKHKYGSTIDIWLPWNPAIGCGAIGLPGKKGCIGGQELVAIDAKGDIKPCLMNKYRFGNIFDDWQGDFGRFLKSDHLRIYREYVNQTNPHCEGCDVYAQCRGGRKTRIIVENRDGSDKGTITLDHMTGYDPYCARDVPKRAPILLGNDIGHFKRIFVAHSL